MLKDKFSIPFFLDGMLLAGWQAIEEDGSPTYIGIKSCEWRRGANYHMVQAYYCSGNKADTHGF